MTRGAFRAAAEQLERYFAGERRAFDLELDLARHSLPARGLGAAARDPLRDHDQLLRAGPRPSDGPTRVRAVAARWAARRCRSWCRATG